MKKIFVLIILFAVQGFAAELHLGGGESAIIQANTQTHVTCDGQGGGGSSTGQSATSKTCGKLDAWGQCQYFNETTITGRYCLEGSVCGKVDAYGKCTFYNVEAACGDHSCTKSKTCGKVDAYGNCTFFNEKVSCN